MSIQFIYLHLYSIIIVPNLGKSKLLTNKIQIKMNKLTPKGQEVKSFREHYDSLPPVEKYYISPKKAFRERMAEITGCTLSAVNGWLAGAYQPNASAKILIEKELGISAEALFPKKESEPCEQ